MIYVLSIIGGILYRMGGMGKPFSSWQRDWLLPIPLSLALIMMRGWTLEGWYLYVIAYGLLGVSLSTYWDELFGYDNFWFHGFVCGMSALPFIWLGVEWWIILVRAVVLGIVIGSLNWAVNKWEVKWRDWIEEIVRGIVIVGSIILLK